MTSIFLREEKGRRIREDRSRNQSAVFTNQGTPRIALNHQKPIER
jgi:hypothetical protein